MSKDKLPFVCPNCGKDFGWGDNSSAPIFLGIVNDLPFNDEPTPCCGHRISGHLVSKGEEIEMVLA